MCYCDRHARMNIYDYLEYYYKQVNLCLAYHDHVNSLPHRDAWTLPSSISSFTCLQPISIPQAGRPKMSRNRSAIEGSSSRRGQVCSKCKGKGHNRASCPTFVAVLNLDVNASGVVQEPTLDGRRRPKK